MIDEFTDLEKNETAQNQRIPWIITGRIVPPRSEKNNLNVFKEKEIGAITSNDDRSSFVNNLIEER